jgi:hypothetical protein
MRKPGAHDLLRNAALYGAAPTQEVRMAHLCERDPDVRRLSWLELLKGCPGYRKLEEARAQR